MEGIAAGKVEIVDNYTLLIVESQAVTLQTGSGGTVPNDWQPPWLSFVSYNPKGITKMFSVSSKICSHALALNGVNEFASN